MTTGEHEAHENPEPGTAPEPPGEPADLPRPADAQGQRPDAPEQIDAGSEGAPQEQDPTQDQHQEHGQVDVPTDEPDHAPQPAEFDAAEMEEAPSDLPQQGLMLRDPVNKVSKRAVGYWTIEAIIGGVFLFGGATIAYFFFLPERWWWATAIYIVLAVFTFVDIVIKPSWQYAVHRWEITDIAVYTRKGWLNREQRIAPLSRVQTVDSKQGALMRLFRLASITVTTASAAGPITIDGLDRDVAEQVVAELTAITGSIEGDAT